jgi:hypothetical protein
MEDDEGLKKQVKKHENYRWDEFMAENKLLVKKHYRHLTALNGFWIFKFFNYKLEDQRISEFESCLNQKRLSPSDSKSIRTIIKDRSQRSKFRDCYKILKKDLNNTSLIVYHGPIRKYRSNIECFYKDAYFPSVYFSCYGYLRPFLIKLDNY